MKLIKILGTVVIFILIILASAVLYNSRSQTIDFSSMLGNEIKVCNNTFNKNHDEYIQLKNWLYKNQTGWENYLATQAAGYIYWSNDLSINVSKGSVVINYGDSNKRSQVFIKADTHEIIGKCDF